MVALPVDDGAGCVPIWVAPDAHRAASLPAAAQPPVAGADASGHELASVMASTKAHDQDAINLLARMTAVKVGIANVLITLPASISWAPVLPHGPLFGLLSQLAVYVVPFTL